MINLILECPKNCIWYNGVNIFLILIWIYEATIIIKVHKFQTLKKIFFLTLSTKYIFYYLYSARRKLVYNNLLLQYENSGFAVSSQIDTYTSGLLSERMYLSKERTSSWWMDAWTDRRIFISVMYRRQQNTGEKVRDISVQIHLCSWKISESITYMHIIVNQ